MCFNLNGLEQARKDKMGQIWYNCGCGCKNTPENMGISRITDSGASTTRNRCKKHMSVDLGDVVSRSTICSECGKEVIFSGRGGTIPELCSVCIKPIRLKKMRARAKKNYKPRDTKYHNKKLYDPERWDCARREICLDGYDGYKCVPCLKCGGYIKRVTNIDDYLYRGNDDTLYHRMWV